MEVPLSPTAAFSIAGGNCNAPCEVTFTSSAQNGTSYLWDFGDGQTASGATIKHTFTTAKTYSVKLIVKGDGGSSGTTESVIIQQPAIPSTVWDKTFGGTNEDRLYCMFPTPDGGFLMGGTSASTDGNKTTPNYGANDYWLVKVKANGEIEWQKTYGGNKNDQLLTIIATPDGGYLLGGYSSSVAGTGNKVAANYGESDYWMVKINGSGNYVWDKSFGGSGADNLTSVAVTSDGGFLLAGYSVSSESGNKSASSYGNTDYWIVKVNGSGDKAWDKAFGGSGADFVTSMVGTSDGGFLVGGHSTSNAGTGNKTAINYGNTDYWALKINSSGDKIWDKSFGGESYDEMAAVLATSDGGVLLGGYSMSATGSGNKGDANYGGYDCWVVKINSGGDKLWDKTFGGRGPDYLTSLVATLDGGFILGCNSSSAAGTGLKTAPFYGVSDYWAVKINSAGGYLWDETFGGTDGDNMFSIVATSDGGFLLGGESLSPDGSGNKTAAYLGGTSDSWIVKIK
ncbi:Ig-like domain-containing protein [Spirosoma flavus]